LAIFYQIDAMRKKSRLRSHASLLACGLFFTTLQAADWPGLRGPAHNGSSPEKGLPSVFSPTEKLKWQRPLPGPSGATPAISGGMVYVSAAVESEQKLYALAYDIATGEERWRHALAEGFRHDDRSNFASPSPTTDGERAYFLYATGDLVAISSAGQIVWKKNLAQEYGRFAIQWTYGSSPVVHEGRLYIQVLQRNEAFDFGGSARGEKDRPNQSYLLALDPATGRELWKHNRPSEAVQESLEAFSSPVLWESAGRRELLISGGDALTGHDPATGREIWRWGTWNTAKNAFWRLVPSPVAGDGSVLVCAPKGEPVYAVKAGLSGSHTDEASLRWRTARNDEDTPTPAHKRISTDVPTPLFYEGHFYILNGDGRRSLACMTPDGTLKWHEELEGKTKIEASPTGADGKIFLIDHAGKVTVIRANPDKFEKLHEASFTDSSARDIRSSIAIGTQRIFVRTHDTLFCVGE
jgi:outer membrane protein assembly factor BamB